MPLRSNTTFRDDLLRKVIARYFLCVFLATGSIAFAVETHCDNQEQIVFNCRIENSKKIVSACKIGPGPLEEQYLQYRFGAPGKLELVFPKQGLARKGQFFFLSVHNKSSNYFRDDLTFKIGRNEYNIYREEAGDMDDFEGKNEENRITNGINVTTSDGKSIALRCDKNVDYDFIPANWLYNVTHND